MMAPSLRSRFSLAGASIVGPAHARVGRNNQDAWATWSGDDFAVLVVADGCSGGVASEVGAQFAARWIAAHAARRWGCERGSRHVELARGLFDGLARELGVLATTLASGPEDIATVVADLLLATVLVAIVDHDIASVFGVGDGLIVIDGAPIVLESDRERGPVYLAYRLCDSGETGVDLDSIAPRLLAEARTGALRSLVLATDGAQALLPANAERDRLTALFEDGQVARRPALLQARLGELAKEPGLFEDDVTLVALLATSAPAGQVGGAV
jgi:hypothetical protein